MTRPATLNRVNFWLCLGTALAAAWMGIAPLGARAAQSLHHDLAVRLDPASRELLVEDSIVVQGRDSVEFTLARRFVVERVLVDGVPVTAAPQPAQAGRNEWRVPLGHSRQATTVAVRYRGRLDPLPDADHREVLHGLPPMADPRGSFLPGGTGWYPQIGTAFFTYRLFLDLPADQRGLVPGRLMDERSEGGRYRATFAFTRPAAAIDLIAGPYQVRERIVRREGGDPLRLRTYFHADLADLADEYLAAVGGYVTLYSHWIGPYAFTEFSVVSGPLPTGFGMPTLTYMGARVLRLPFIRTSSLGHEILHNWWGNGVYADFDQGNWSEGLTAFMADYTYKEQEGPDAAREARLELLRDIAAIPPGQDAPLRRFTSRSHGTSQIVGYHKGTFLFLMLRDLLGTSVFDAGLQRFWRDRQFRAASWADLERAFEEASGRKLDRFFDQWLSRSGAPRFRIERARVARTASGHRIWITLGQDEPAFAATVPVAVTTPTGRIEYPLDVAGVRQEFVLDVSARPESVTLDPDFRVLRHLDAAEMPPILRQVIVDPTTVTIAASTAEPVRSLAADLSRALLDYPRALGDAAMLPAGGSLLVIGLSADVDRLLARANLPRQPQSVGSRGTAQVWTAYQPNGKALAVVSAESADALRALLRPLPHYGRQSYLIFEGSRAVERGVWPAPGREWRLSPPE
jgi:aminopeptidase N